MRRILTVLIICFSLLCGTVFADTLDINEIGTISVTIQVYGTEQTVSGGTLSLYKIADVSDGINYVYTFDYDNCSIDLSDTELLDQAGTADVFAEYTEEYNIQPIETKTIQSPTVFDDVSVGLYMIIQTESSDSYEPISPFLVTVPMLENGTYVYHVDASPKTQQAIENTTVTSEPEVSPVVSNVVNDNNNGTSVDGTGTTQNKTSETEGTVSAKTGEPVSFMCMFGVAFIAVMDITFAITAKKRDRVS